MYLITYLSYFNRNEIQMTPLKGLVGLDVVTKIILDFLMVGSSELDG